MYVPVYKSISSQTLQVIHDTHRTEILGTNYLQTEITRHNAVSPSTVLRVLFPARAHIATLYAGNARTKPPPCYLPPLKYSTGATIIRRYLKCEPTTPKRCVVDFHCEVAWRNAQTVLRCNLYVLYGTKHKQHYTTIAVLRRHHRRS